MSTTELDPEAEQEVIEAETADTPMNTATSPSPATGPSAKGAVTKEDESDFDHSTVEITITLHAQAIGEQDADRLVTIGVHNHHGIPVFRWFHQSELSEKGPLDRLQRGVALTVQDFHLELARRKREQGQKAKRPSPKTQRTATANGSATATIGAVTDAAPAGEGKAHPEEADTAAVITPSQVDVLPTRTPDPTPVRGDLVQQNLF